MKYFSIEEKLFKTEPLFVISTPEELERLLTKKYKINCDLKWLKENGFAEGTVLHFYDYKPCRVVWLLRMRKGNKEDLAIFIHELTHLVIRICEDKGIAIKSNLSDGRVNDEPIAYMMDYFTREFLYNIYK